MSSSLDVLVATVNQTDQSLVDRMNIQSSAIICNQGDSFGCAELRKPFGTVQFISYPDRGVGKNRNVALMRSTADFCLFADDDERFVDGYDEAVLHAFQEYRDADVIVFNIRSENPARPLPVIKTAHRVRIWNGLRYAAPAIAIRRDRVLRKNILFTLMFGGGTLYGSGEDSLFLVDCMRRGLKVMAVPRTIATKSLTESSWFTGYNHKYLSDKGALFRALAGRGAPVLCTAFALKHRDRLTQFRLRESLKIMLQGAASYDGDPSKPAEAR